MTLDIAVRLFKERLGNAVKGESIIYIATEKEQVELLPEETIKILVKADLETEESGEQRDCCPLFLYKKIIN